MTAETIPPLATEERNRALEALARMKQLEAKRAKKMRSVRLDSRTVVTSTPKRLKEITEDMGTKRVNTGASPVSRKENARQKLLSFFLELFGDRDTLTYAEIKEKAKELMITDASRLGRIARGLKHDIIRRDPENHWTIHLNRNRI